MAYVALPQEPQRGFGVVPLAIVAPIAGGLIHGSSTGSSNSATDSAYNRVVAGGPDARGALQFLVAAGGFTSNGGWHGAVGKGADTYARTKLGQLVEAGLVIGPTVDPQHWYTNPTGWRLAGAAATAGNPVNNPFGDAGADRKLATPDALASLTGGANLTTLALIGLGAFLLSKVVK